MTTQMDAFVSAMGAAVGWTSEQITAVQAAADEYFPTTPSDLASSVVSFITNAGVRDDSYNAYFTGTATGGPNGNGTYPITLYGGGTVTLPCPAALAQTIERGADAQTGLCLSVTGPFNPNDYLTQVVSPGAQLLTATATTGRCKVAPTANTTLVLKKNGTQVGTVTFAAGSLNSVTCTLTDNTVAAGDGIELYAPATVDPTFLDFAITLTNGAT